VIRRDTDCHIGIAVVVYKSELSTGEVGEGVGALHQTRV
jgi:hypothetical protein